MKSRFNNNNNYTFNLMVPFKSAKVTLQRIETKIGIGITNSIISFLTLLCCYYYLEETNPHWFQVGVEMTHYTEGIFGDCIYCALTYLSRLSDNQQQAEQNDVFGMFFSILLFLQKGICT